MNLIRPFYYLCLLLVSVLACGSSAQAGVQLPEGIYHETTIDIQVKALGGDISMKRSWYDDQWHFNRAWNSLKLTYDNLDDSLKSIERNLDVYTRSNSAATLFRFDKRSTINVTGTGFRWQDRQGNWITYDQNGRITAYGDRNNVRVSMLYNGEQLSEVRDHLNQLMLSYEYSAGRLSAVKDSSGRQVQYRYTGDRLTTVVDVRGNAWVYTYDGSKLKTRTDPEGRVLTITYFSNDTVSSTKDQDNVGVDYSYDYDNLKKQYYVQFKSTSGRIEEAWYDRDGLLIRQDIAGITLRTVSKDTNKRNLADRNGAVTVSEYDEFENVIKQTYPDGSTVSYDYDPVYSNLTRRVDENGIITKNDYDDKGNLIRSTEALGKSEQRITEYRYDQYGNLTQAKRLSDAVSAEAIIRLVYDDYGNIKTSTNPEGQSTDYTYDIQGNVLTRKDPRDKLWVYTYNDAGNLTSAKNPLGDAATYGYDKVGNRIRETDGNHKITRFEYDKRYNLLKITDPYAKEKVCAYNHDNQLVRDADEEEKAVTYEYDLAGRLIKTTDGNNNVTRLDFADESLPDSGNLGQASAIHYPTFQQQLKYDKLNRPLLDTVFLGSEALISRYQYDAIGNVIAVTDRNGKLTRYEYDVYQRPFRQIDALGNITELSYDNRDNVRSVKDGKGSITRFEYDKHNRLSKETSPLGQAVQYAYDPNNNLIERLDAQGQKTRYGFDAANRRTLTEYFNVGASTPTQSITYTYDAEGYLTGWDDGSASATLSYDDVNRKTRETVDYGPFSLTHRYTYYANGQKKSYTGPDGITYDYRFDANNQLSSVQLPGQGAITVNSYQWFAPRKITLPGGATQDYRYDSLLRADAITLKDPAQRTLLDHSYRYDNENNVLEKNTGQGNSRYGYDDLYRLTQADHSTQPDEAYTYDALGNRLTDSQIAGNWSYDANHRLTAYGTTTYSYDANGNTSEKTLAGQTTHYLYDVQNRLTEVQDNELAPIARYGYDPSGRRLWKEVSGSRTYFLYADEGLVGEYSASGAQLKSYGYQPDSVGTTAPLFMKVGDNYYFYQNDRLGTPQQLIDESGAVVWSATQAAFGRATIATASIENNLRFPGQYHDVETGLYYNLHRYYDPASGRYLTSDPIGLAGGMNTYAYVGGNPLKFTDPYGLDFNDFVDGFFDAVVPKDEDGLPYALPQGLVNFSVGVGDDIISTLSFGLLEGQEIRDDLGIDGGVDRCSTQYRIGNVALSVIPGRTAAKVAGKGLRGLETRGVKPAPGTRVRPEGIPDGWRIRPTKGKGGTEYYNPKNPNESVRVMQGNPKSPYPNSQKPYARQRDGSGSYLDQNGNRAPNKSPDTHIPLDQFRFRE